VTRRAPSRAVPGPRPRKAARRASRSDGSTGPSRAREERTGLEGGRGGTRLGGPGGTRPTLPAAGRHRTARSAAAPRPLGVNCETGGRNAWHRVLADRCKRGGLVAASEATGNSRPAGQRAARGLPFDGLPLEAHNKQSSRIAHGPPPHSSTPSLLSLPGCGPLTAAKLLLAETAGVDRFCSEASFAMHAGVAPIPASSGRTNRHRLCRGSNRQLNAALHRIAITQLRLPRQATAYYQRRRVQGDGPTRPSGPSSAESSRAVYQRLGAALPPGDTVHTADA
jgi:Transposase IS116/IS110/IS902 family